MHENMSHLLVGIFNDPMRMLRRKGLDFEEERCR